MKKIIIFMVKWMPGVLYLMEEFIMKGSVFPAEQCELLVMNNQPGVE